MRYNASMKTDTTEYPTADAIRAARKKYGKTQAEACALVRLKSNRSWQQAEKGTYRMHPAFLELFVLRCELEIRGIKLHDH